MAQLTRKELRIIEQTKREGEAAEKAAAEENPKPRKNQGLRSMLKFAGIFFLFVFIAWFILWITT